MMGMTRGEIILTAFIFALIYSAGLLPRLVAKLGARARREGGDSGTG